MNHDHEKHQTNLSHIFRRHIRFMVACYIISRPVGRISRTQFTAATHRRYQHIGHECLPDTRRTPPKYWKPRSADWTKCTACTNGSASSPFSGSILHWATKQFPKWLVALGLFDGKKPPRPPMQEILTLKDWLATQRHLAEEIGEIAFYVAIVLHVAALIKRIPYRWFAKLHILVVPVYLALVWHTIVLVNFSYWSQPLGWLIITALGAGIACSLIALFKRIGNPQNATVSALNQNGKLLSLTLNAPKWQGHCAGQFLFLRTHGESHPFTIASDWQPDNQELTLVIKDLGDYTHRLPQRLNIGDTVQIDGAYGRFDFSDKQAQIWVSNGIGFTPFLARLNELAKQPITQSIDWFHADRNLSADTLAHWQNLAQRANVNFHYIPSGTQRLTAEHIGQTVRDSANRSLWLCGSSSFTRSISDNLKTRSQHLEFFEFR